MKAKISILILLLATSFYAVSADKNKGKSPTFTKKDTVHIIGHAHQDMTWLWDYQENLKMFQSNFRQVAAFMDEFPDFRMGQSEAVIYDYIEKVDPPLFKKLQQYVKEGRLELTGGMWVESDQNMPSGEGFSRSILLGQRYFRDKFGTMSKVGWLPDDFGHTSQLPQMLKLMGCDYFYFMRCGAYQGPFWWIGPDSSKVLCYTGGSYNGNVTEEELIDRLKNYSIGTHRVIHPVGNGDHGGGPSRENIEMVHKLDQQKKFPAVKFSTALDFFQKMAKEKNLPTHRGEMQYIFEGCYTTVAENKEGNRNCENRLFEGELLNSIRWFNSGAEYPANEFREVWKDVAFNQFHDIIPGSAIYESNRQTAGRYVNDLTNALGLRDNAFRQLADEVQFQTGKGQPVVAYNMQPFGRKALIEAEVFSYKEPATAKFKGWGDFYGSKYVTPVDAGQGNVASVLVQDANGKKYPAQIVWGKSTPPGYTYKVEFVVDEMPAGGYKTFYVDITKPSEDNEIIPFSNNTFETDFFKIKIDPANGDITSLIDKRTNTEYVKAGGHLNTLRIFNEDRKGQMKSWTINKNISIEDVTNVEPLGSTDRGWMGELQGSGNASEKLRIENGNVRACIEATKTWGNSKFIVRTYIYRSYPRIDYDVEVHWLERGGDDKESPMLRAVFPLATTDSRFYNQVPYNVVERPANGKFNGGEIPEYLMHHKDNPNTVEMEDGQEVPAQKWVDVNNGKTGIALLNKTKYGHSYHNGELRLTLMRSAGHPDIYPNLGKFNISYSLYPHSGDWTNGVMLEGEAFNIPVYAAEPPSLALVKEHATRPEEASFISLDKSNVLLSGVKQSEDGDELIVRICEMEGKETTTEVKLPANIRSARILNLVELPLEGAATPEVNGNTVKVKMRGHEIVTLGIRK